MAVDLGVWNKMKRKGLIDLDTKLFQRRLAKLAKQAAPAAIKKGLAQAGLQLMGDAIEKEPSVPLDLSTLQGSGSVHVNEKLSATSKNMARRSGGNPTPNESPIGKESKFETTIGFNTPYATRLHEHPEYAYQQQKGTEGGKFLEYKLFAFGKDYTKIIADTIKESLSNPGTTI